MQMRFISTRARAKEIVKHTNNANLGRQEHKQGQMRFLSTKKIANEVHKNKIKGKRGC